MSIDDIYIYFKYVIPFAFSISITFRGWVKQHNPLLKKTANFVNDSAIMRERETEGGDRENLPSFLCAVPVLWEVSDARRSAAQQ